jgi:molybdopterin converting factor small subunit
MAEVEIRLFATLRDRAGQSKITVEIAGPTTVAELLQQACGSVSGVGGGGAGGGGVGE